MNNKVRIGNFCKVRRGASPRPIDDIRYFGGDVGWIRISDVTKSFKYLNKTEQYVSPLGESLSVRVDKGDLVMSICGTIGRPIIINIPSCIHDGFVQLYDIIDADKEFLYYILQHHEKDLERKGQPGTQVNLNTTIVENFEIYFPAKNTQTQIAKILSTADTVIEKTQAAIAKYKAMKQGMLHDLFTRGIDLATNKLRSRYEDAPHLYKESKLGMIPKEWEEVQLGQVGEFKNGINKDKNSFGFGTLFVNIGDAYIEALDCSTLNRVKVIPSEIHDYELLKGDLLFVRSSVKPSGIGYNTLFTEFYEPVVFCGFMIRYRFECKTEFIPEFYNSYFRNEEFRNRLIGVSTVSANTNINQVALSGLVAIKPQIKEQQIIAERLKSIDNKLQTEQTYLHKMQLLKKGLMEDLLSGRKRVKINIQNKC